MKIIPVTLYLLWLSSLLIADVKSTSGEIDFIPNLSTGSIVMTVNEHSVQSGSNSLQMELYHHGLKRSGFQAATDNITLSGNSIVLADTSSGNLSIELPDVSSYSGAHYTIKKISSNNELYIGSANLIDGYDRIQLKSSTNLIDPLEVFSNGEQWYIFDQPQEAYISSANLYKPTSTTNLMLWLDGTDRSTFTIGESDNISQWSDKSGYARHALQSDASFQPAWSGNGVAFSGSGYLGVDMFAPLDNWDSEKAIVFVVSYGAAADNIYLHYGQYHGSGHTGNDEQFEVNSETRARFRQKFESSENVYLRDNSSSIIDVRNGAMVVYSSGNTGTQIHRVLRTNGNNSYDNLSDLTTDNDPEGQLILGCDFDGNGSRTPGIFAVDVTIHELMVFDHMLSLDTSQRIEGYLAHKYELTSRLSANHPYINEIPLEL
ncbi:MAG: hypothetical protein HQL32_08695 [Planctomycetes bacterium]|nr:hypothetical protein [Planctomycetota bacterium]